MALMSQCQFQSHAEPVNQKSPKNSPTRMLPATDILSPDLKGPTQLSPPQTKIKAKIYLLEHLRIGWLIEVQLLVLTFVTGIQDAISFPDFHCFASNQTGNTVILAVGIAGSANDNNNLFDLRSVGISLSAFIVGAFSTGQIAHFVGTHRRFWLVSNNLVQTLMTIGAAVVQQLNPGEKLSFNWIAIALLAFSSGAQVASMRPMRIQEITTAMATAAWIDLVIDKALFGLKNHPRDRRAFFLAALVMGSFAGAYMHVSIGSANTLFVSAAGKLLVTFSLLFNPCQPPDMSYRQDGNNLQEVSAV